MIGLLVHRVISVTLILPIGLLVKNCTISQGGHFLVYCLAFVLFIDSLRVNARSKSALCPKPRERHGLP